MFFYFAVFGVWFSICVLYWNFIRFQSPISCCANFDLVWATLCFLSLFFFPIRCYNFIFCFFCPLLSNRLSPWFVIFFFLPFSSFGTLINFYVHELTFTHSLSIQLSFANNFLFAFQLTLPLRCFNNNNIFFFKLNYKSQHRCVVIFVDRCICVWWTNDNIQPICVLNEIHVNECNFDLIWHHFV